MASDLERIADAVRHLADAKGQVRPYLARAADDARRTADRVPSGVPSATATVACLQQASVTLQRVSMLLDSFADDAVRFADDVAGGRSAGGRAQAAASAGVTRPPLATALPEGFSGVRLDDIEEINPDLEFKKASEADLVWAAEALRDVILPGLERGLSHDDFRDMDMELNQWGTRSYADTYGGFFGKESIVLDRWESGRLHVANGRHRILAARRAGFTWLPAPHPPSRPT